MDVLEKYKETWKNQPEDTKKVSKVDIYKMAHKKSSSIVKWIFIIGIIEFLLIIPMYFIDFPSIKNSPILSKIEDIYKYIGVFLTFFIVYFLYKFYTNYKSISTSDSTKELMSKILKTRKTVRTYVYFNLGIMLFILLYEIWLIYQEYFFDKNAKQIFIFILIAIITMAIVLLITLGIYQLLYGILLRKLHRNYKELAKLEELN